MEPVTIRPGVESDLPQLNEIYNHYVRTAASTFDLEPRTVADRIPWFREHSTTGRHRLFVACEGDHLVGFASTTKFRPRPAYDRTVESSVYCRPDRLGRGLGSMLYTTLFESIAAEDVHQVVAGIAEGNPGSVALHVRFGFQKIGVFREVGFKFDRYWSVTWYQRSSRLELPA